MLRVGGIVVILFVQAMLYGCSTHVDDDVVEFVQEIKSRKTQAIEPLPPFPHAENFKYKATDLRDPFEPFSAPKAEANPGYQAGGPDLNRAREPLEAFPLDSLLMVGTLEREGDFFALIKDNTGIVHTAQIGNYVGQNSGKIQKINDSMIEVREWLPNGKGGFKEHLTILPLIKANEDVNGHDSSN